MIDHENQNESGNMAVDGLIVDEGLDGSEKQTKMGWCLLSVFI